MLREEGKRCVFTFDVPCVDSVPIDVSAWLMKLPRGAHNSLLVSLGGMEEKLAFCSSRRDTGVRREKKNSLLINVNVTVRVAGRRSCFLMMTKGGGS